jgi:hypothetical protein
MMNNSSNTTLAPIIMSATTGYLNALQVCASILTMMLFGFFWKALGVVGPSAALVNGFTVFMYNVGIPALAFKGLAIQKFASLPWSYIAVFFCLRVVLFLLWVLVDGVLFRTSIGVLTGDYMNSSTDFADYPIICTHSSHAPFTAWINTIIFGIPIYVALFGPASAVYPVFASISSFFFQLPLQLILFEVHRHRTGLLPLESPTKSDLKRDGIEYFWTATSIDLSPNHHSRLKWVFKLVLSMLINPIMIAIVGYAQICSNLCGLIF